MKKLALLASMLAIVAVVGGGVASATGDPVVVDEATGFACGVFDADGNIFLTENSSSKLLQNGKEILHCIGTGTGNGTVVTQEGFACGMVFTGISENPNNHSRVSKSGVSQLWCYGHTSPIIAPTGGTAGAIG
jgi:hypothetical protein